MPENRAIMLHSLPLEGVNTKARHDVVAWNGLSQGDDQKKARILGFPVV